jgi:exonuclease III
MRSGGRFTWRNKQVNPVMVNLDWVLMSPEWTQHFPLCSVASLVRIGSDHAPLILNIEEGSVAR